MTNFQICSLLLFALAAAMLIRQILIFFQFGVSDQKRAEKLVLEIYKNYNLPEDRRVEMYQFVLSCLHNNVPAQALGIKLCFEFDITSDKRKQK